MDKMKNKLCLVSFILGIWIISSPWVIGFSGLILARWSNIFSGTAVSLLSLWIWLGEEK